MPSANGERPESIEPSSAQLRTINMQKLHRRGFHQTDSKPPVDEDIDDVNQSILRGDWTTVMALCMFLVSTSDKRASLETHMLYIYSKMIELGEDPRCNDRMMEVLEAMNINDDKIQAAFEIGYRANFLQHINRFPNN